MKKIDILNVIICMALFACNKEPDELPYIRPESIVAGTTGNMQVNQYDRLIAGGYNSKKSIDLDLNNDSLADFRLTSEIFGSPGMGMHPTVNLMSLHPNSMMNGYLLPDTTFFHYRPDTITNADNGQVYIYHTKIYSCQRIDFSDSVVSIRPNVFYIRYFNLGETVLTSDTYNSDTLGLSNLTYSEIPENYETNDTLLSFRTNYHYTCNSIPNDQIIYIGVKLNDSSNEKLGWIKLSVMDQYEVVLLETALQQ